jgi:hypothetical protein
MTGGPVGRGVAVLVAVACVLIGFGAGVSAAGGSWVRPEHLAPGAAPPGASVLGPLPASQTIDLRVVLPPSNQGALQALLQDLYNPQSPLFHDWLSSAEFLADFGPSPASVSAVDSWLHGAGLMSTSLAGFAVDISASEQDVATALGTSFERYRARSGADGYLAQQTPLVPESLAGGQISAILGLNTLTQFVPLSTPAPAVSGGISPQPEADGLTPCAAAVRAATTPSGDYYTLDELGAAYGIGTLLVDGQNGHGETIGLYELASHSVTDVETYESCFGLTDSVSTVPVDGGGGAVGGGGTAEADLDIEQAATQAPGASIISYEGPNDTDTGAYDTWYAIVHADAVQVISTSWGECEPLASEDGDLSSFPTLFEEAAAQGQTVVAAAGDSGSEGCFAQNGSTSLEVDYPASDEDVTTVGGTELFSPSDEVTWNFCQTDESLPCAVDDGGMAAGGGGMSIYIQRPNWQPGVLEWTGSLPPCGPSCREVPDISANAGVGMVVYADGSWAAGGGTSFAAPLVAGLVADRNDGCTTSSGLWTPALYGLAAEGAYGTALTDVTSGNNDMTGSNGGEYPATSGYDGATGLGSPRAAGLSCPEITSIQPSMGLPGTEVTVFGLGLEHATISFGGTPAQVVSANATQATVVVPAGSGTVPVDGSSVLGSGIQSSSFTYPTATAYTALQPFRICDTRSSAVTGYSTECSSDDPLGQGQTMTFPVTGVTVDSESVPSDAQSVVLNVTAISGTAGTFLTVYPAGSAVPTASNLNVDAASNQANLVVVALGTDGQVSIYNSLGSINIAVDVQGYFAGPSGSSSIPGLFHPISPLRICDSRSGTGTACSGSPLGPGQWTKVVVSGCPSGDPTCTSVPTTDAAAVALNLTAVSGTSLTYMAVEPAGVGGTCPSGTPQFSNVNVNPQTNLPNRVIVPLGPDQGVCVYNSLGTINFILDVNGWFGTGSESSQGAEFYAISPTRICDTRSVASVGYSTECSGDTLGPGGTLRIPVAGVDGPPPAGGSSPPVAVIANVTAVSGSAFTYFTLYPANVALPNASDLNVSPQQNTPNLCIVQLASTGSSAGEMDLFNDLGSINAIVDVAGWFQP